MIKKKIKEKEEIEKLSPFEELLWEHYNFLAELEILIDDNKWKVLREMWKDQKHIPEDVRKEFKDRGYDEFDL